MRTPARQCSSPRIRCRTWPTAIASSFLAREGHLAFFGTVAEALDYFAVERFEEVYERLAWEETPERWAQRFEEHRGGDPVAPAAAEQVAPPARDGIGFAREWAVLTRRTFETLVRNRLTLAILLGSPALVVAMFAVLFRPGAFDFAEPSPSAITMILFWVTFGAFFFGLTYGLLQIVTEQAILYREHFVGQRLSAYLLSKIAVLLPFLVFVVILMLAVLRALDRLPGASATTYLTVGITLALLAAAALTLGLLTSAAVSNPAQATLALPMLCFPAVLFSGAILPVHDHGRRRRGDQRDHPGPLGVRGAGARPRRPPPPLGRRVAARPASGRVVRRRRDAGDRRLLALPDGVHGDLLLRRMAHAAPPMPPGPEMKRQWRGYPNVNAYASAPGSRNVISSVRSWIAPGWRTSW